MNPEQAPKRRLGILTWCAAACIAAALLSVIAAMVLLYLKSPRVGNESPWIEAALDNLKGIVSILLVASVITKGLAQLFEQH